MYFDELCGLFARDTLSLSLSLPRVGGPSDDSLSLGTWIWGMVVVEEERRGVFDARLRVWPARARPLSLSWHEAVWRL